MILFFLFLGLYVLACCFNFYTIHHRKQPGMAKAMFISKCFLMPLLLLSYVFYCFGSQEKLSLWPVLALFFGWGGDVLLEFGKNWFIPGLISFLVGHVFWIISFLLPVDFFSVSPLLYLPLIILILYSFFLLRTLYKEESTKGLHVPLFFYAAILVVLCEASLLRASYASTLQFLTGLFGAFLFMVSDSLLSQVMFRRKKENFIMLTYTLAQLLLMLTHILR